MSTGNGTDIFIHACTGLDPSKWDDKSSKMYRKLEKGTDKAMMEQKQQYDDASKVVSGLLIHGLSHPKAEKELRAVLAVRDQTDGIAMVKALWAIRREFSTKYRRRLAKSFSAIAQMSGETVDAFLLRFAAAHQKMVDAKMPMDESMVTQTLLDGLTAAGNVRKDAEQYMQMPGMDKVATEAERRTMLVEYLNDNYGTIKEHASRSGRVAAVTNTLDPFADTMSGIAAAADGTDVHGLVNALTDAVQRVRDGSRSAQRRGNGRNGNK